MSGPEAPITFQDIIGDSSEMQEVLKTASQVAPTDATVLLLGESGTGKELLARAIHAASRRQDGPFIKVDCTSLPEGLLESELFGHEKGAFTDATEEKPGRFELAHGGTIFLDEIGEMPPSLQAKLLRVLQERSFERVGGTKTHRVDVRILAATNRDLGQALREHRFREDLYFRLNVVPIAVPPLRKRPEDVPRLAEYFLRWYAERYGKAIPGFAPEAIFRLRQHHWPGNVRELEHVIERAVILWETGPFSADFLPTAESAPVQGLMDGEGMTLEELEREYIRRVLHKVRGHKGKAATILGINRKTLWEKRKRYGLD
ncbi:MAG: sigma-54 interaction domain-containing protein [Candidatus Methylomirabilales bacterium]